jgi:hypothetical protein
MILNGYNKAIKVIESCENDLHLQAAKRYINLFFRKYSIEKSGTFIIDSVLEEFYSELKSMLELKKFSLRGKNN